MGNLAAWDWLPHFSLFIWKRKRESNLSPPLSSVIGKNSSHLPLHHAASTSFSHHSASLSTMLPPSLSLTTLPPSPTSSSHHTPLTNLVSSLSFPLFCACMHVHVDEIEFLLYFFFLVSSSTSFSLTLSLPSPFCVHLHVWLEKRISSYVASFSPPPPPIFLLSSISQHSLSFSLYLF